MHRSLLSRVVVAASAATLSACGSSSAPTSPAKLATSVVDVSPVGGATNVATSTEITITFNHAMMAGMEQYIALHRDSLTGPTVSGTVSWSSDHMQLTFTPDAPLKSHTTYVLHLGGGMMDADDAPISYAQCPAFGGQSVSGSMMGGGGMMGGGMGPEMGNGWQGSDGDYGMEFVFTTA